MTHAELMQAIVAMWPRSTPSTWVRAWSPIYQQALGRHAGPALAAAWQATMASWTFARPPAPADIAKHLPDNPLAGMRKSDARGERPLPFGTEHFAVCKAMADELFGRWLDHHRQWLPEGDATASHAIAEARVRARHQAMLLAHRGLEQVPESAAIEWTPTDWDVVRQRAESQQRHAARTKGMGSGRLKPLHVAIGADGLARLAKHVPVQQEPPAWLDEAPPAEAVA